MAINPNYDPIVRVRPGQKTDRFGNPIYTPQFPDPIQSVPINNPSNTPNSPTSAPTQQSGYEYYLSKFKDTPYYNDANFQNIVRRFSDAADNERSRPDNSQATYNGLTGYVDEFTAQFSDLVGRAPNEVEYNKFFKYLGGEDLTSRWMGNDTFTPKVQGLLSSQFRRTAEEEATKQAQAQVDAQMAPNSAFNTWKNSVNQNVNDTATALQDYQTRLFEKLRPQLLTSLQSQGLLNTGALNEAFAGAASDLTQANQGYVAQMKNAAGQDIANQEYAIRSSPGNYALQNTYGRVPSLTQAGQTAIQGAYQGALQGQLMNQQYGYQQNLLNQQANNQPSYLQQIGGQIVGGIAAGYGSRLGRG